MPCTSRVERFQSCTDGWNFPDLARGEFVLANHSVSERTSLPISACTAARTGLPSCMMR